MKTSLKSELLSSSSMVFLSKRKNRKIRLIAVFDKEKIKEYTIFPGMHVTTILTQNSGSLAVILFYFFPFIVAKYKKRWTNM